MKRCCGSEREGCLADVTVINSLSPAQDRKPHGSSVGGGGAVRTEAGGDSTRGGSASSTGKSHRVVWLAEPDCEGSPTEQLGAARVVGKDKEKKAGQEMSWLPFHEPPSYQEREDVALGTGLCLGTGNLECYQ